MNTVLVIEDNKDNMRLISYALTRSGYEVVSAWTGEEGLECLTRDRPLFVILDINLPGIDGYQTARRIRSMESLRDVPIVAITSYAMAGDSDKILKAGCNAYFEKPVDPLTIVENIQKALGLKK